jgi:hypothetical protein
MKQRNGKIKVCHFPVKVLKISMLGETINRNNTRPRLGKKMLIAKIHRCIAQNKRKNRRWSIFLFRNTAISVIIKKRTYVQKEKRKAKGLA